MQEHEFQSSPGLSTGRYVPTLTTARQPGVFQSSPGLSTGRYSLPLFPIVITSLFQSSPGLSTGRYGRRRRRRDRRGRCFNPRPAFRPDATTSCGLQCRLYCCFNPRPAFRPDATSEFFGLVIDV